MILNEDQSAPKTVLFVLLGAIGDVVRALPLAVRIKTFWPGVKLHWAVEPPSRQILEEHPAVDRVILFDRPKGIKEYLSFIAELRQENYDLILDLQRHLKSGFTSFISRKRRSLGFGYNNSRELNWLFHREHIEALPHFSSKVDHFQMFGDYLGLQRLDPLVFGLTLRESALGRVESILSQQSLRLGIELPSVPNRMGLVLGSSWPSRFWIVEYYRELIYRVWDKWGIVSLLIGGNSEVEFAEAILSGQSKIPAVNLVKQTGIRDLVELFSIIRLVVGSDSGPMHIAAAVGLPVVSLWGSTSPDRSAPIGSEQYVLRSTIGCSPCYRKICPGLDRLCMRQISCDLVLDKIDMILGEGEG